MRASFRGGLGVLLATTLLTACGQMTTTVHEPGEVVVVLTSPFADDGAVLIRLFGLPPGNVEVTADQRGVAVYSVRVADTLKIAVFGTPTSGPLVRIGPFNGDHVSLIGVRLDDVASQSNAQREALSGYAVALRR